MSLYEILAQPKIKTKNPLTNYTSKSNNNSLTKVLSQSDSKSIQSNILINQDKKELTNVNSKSVNKFFCIEDSNSNNFMEDSCLLIDCYSNNPNKGLFIVCDGHGGEQASKYVKEKISYYFKRCFSKKSSFETAIKDTFLKVNSDLKTHSWSNTQGTTALVVYVVKETQKNDSEEESDGENTSNNKSICNNNKENDKSVNHDHPNHNMLKSPEIKYSRELNLKKTESIHAFCGPTIQENLNTYHIFSANVGDTQAILVSIKNISKFKQLIKEIKIMKARKSKSKSLYCFDFDDNVIGKDFKDVKNENPNYILSKYNDSNHNNSSSNSKIINDNDSHDPTIQKENSFKESKSKFEKESIDKNDKGKNRKGSLNIDNLQSSLLSLTELISIKQLSLQHRITNSNEKKRVETEGGTIFDEKIKKNFLLTRCFGSFNLSKNNNGLTVEPFVSYQKIESEFNSSKVLILATDGVWDFLNEKTLINILIDSELDNALLVSKIVSTAKNKGSNDNITCVVVELF